MKKMIRIKNGKVQYAAKFKIWDGRCGGLALRPEKILSEKWLPNDMDDRDLGLENKNIRH